MSPRLSARDASILTLIAETPQISEEQLDAIVSLATSDEVKTVARILWGHAWNEPEYPADVKEFARAIYDAAQDRRRRREHIEDTASASA